MDKKFYKLKKFLIWLLSRIAAILLSVMTILIIYQVFTRYILNNPADFTEEIIRYMLIWTGFIGAAYGFLTREHMALTLIPDRVNPKAQKVLRVIIDLIILLVALFVIVIGGFKLVHSAQAQRSALLGIPRSLVYVVAPISGIFIILAQIINLWESWTGNVVEITTNSDNLKEEKNRYDGIDFGMDAKKNDSSYIKSKTFESDLD